MTSHFTDVHVSAQNKKESELGTPEVPIYKNIPDIEDISSEELLKYLDDLQLDDDDRQSSVETIEKHADKPLEAGREGESRLRYCFREAIICVGHLKHDRYSEVLRYLKRLGGKSSNLTPLQRKEFRNFLCGLGFAEQSLRVYKQLLSLKGKETGVHLGEKEESSSKLAGSSLGTITNKENMSLGNFDPKELSNHLRASWLNFSVSFSFAKRAASKGILKEILSDLNSLVGTDGDTLVRTNNIAPL